MPSYRMPKPLKRLSFNDADPAHQDFQYLEDCATAYWYSEILFAAIELGLFDLLDRGISSLDGLSEAASCRREELHRLLKAMEGMALVGRQEDQWSNSQVAGMFLVKGKASYLGDFFLYRRYLRPSWQALVQRVSLKEEQRQVVPEKDNYVQRNLHYVVATDGLMRQKAKEIAGLLRSIPWRTPVLDIGGGAGSLVRALIRSKGDASHRGLPEGGRPSCLFELPETIQAAKSVYPHPTDWDMIETIEGDFRSYEFDPEQNYGLVVVSNFLHAYGADEARALLNKAIQLMETGGMVLIHDYFPDRLGRSPQKGSLYDLNMMLNTYNGTCHESAVVIQWLQEGGLTPFHIGDLSTDTAVILASQSLGQGDMGLDTGEKTNLEQWVYFAREEGFRHAVVIPAGQVDVSSWVRHKCKFGCDGYGKNLQCPPYGLDSDQTREIIQAYSWCLIVEGMPPGRDFHRGLLALEKKAFLSGFHKAFAFGAGPCPVCDPCPTNGPCRHPSLARPSMESSGIDVYTTARQAGINLNPVLEKGRYVKYIGLLFLE